MEPASVLGWTGRRAGAARIRRHPSRHRVVEQHPSIDACAARASSRSSTTSARRSGQRCGPGARDASSQGASLVGNAEGVPALDFDTASLQGIEALFRRFGGTLYLLNEPVFKAMNERAAPTPW